MKKFIIIVLFSILFTSNVYSDININKNDIISVKLDKCIDGDTASFIYKKERIKVRFLAINTPEIGKNKEKYGEEASSFTCNKLKQAKSIKLEFDQKSTIKDKYGRYLAWIFVDDELLQKELIRNSLAEIKYIYDDYKYVTELKILEKKVKQNHKKIWEQNDDSIYIFLAILFVCLLLIYLLGHKKKKYISF